MGSGQLRIHLHINGIRVTAIFPVLEEVKTSASNNLICHCWKCLVGAHEAKFYFVERFQHEMQEMTLFRSYDSPFWLPGSLRIISQV